MSDDDLREKLTGVLADASAYRNPGDVADALMPVVREALADAWDAGFNAGERDVFEHESTGDWESECIRNPWRGRP